MIRLCFLAGCLIDLAISSSRSSSSSDACGELCRRAGDRCKKGSYRNGVVCQGIFWLDENRRVYLFEGERGLISRRVHLLYSEAVELISSEPSVDPIVDDDISDDFPSVLSGSLFQVTAEMHNRLVHVASVISNGGSVDDCEDLLHYDNIYNGMPYLISQISSQEQRVFVSVAIRSGLNEIGVSILNDLHDETGRSSRAIAHGLALIASLSSCFAPSALESHALPVASDVHDLIQGILSRLASDAPQLYIEVLRYMELHSFRTMVMGIANDSFSVNWADRITLSGYGRLLIDAMRYILDWRGGYEFVTVFNLMCVAALKLGDQLAESNNAIISPQGMAQRVVMFNIIQTQLNLLWDMFVNMYQLEGLTRYHISDFLRDPMIIPSHEIEHIQNNREFILFAGAVSLTSFLIISTGDPHVTRLVPGFNRLRALDDKFVRFTPLLIHAKFDTMHVGDRTMCSALYKTLSFDFNRTDIPVSVFAGRGIMSSLAILRRFDLMTEAFHGICPLEMRLALFKSQVTTYPGEIYDELDMVNFYVNGPSMAIRASRTHMPIESVRSLARISRDQFEAYIRRDGAIIIEFIGEEAADGGGPFREWIHTVTEWLTNDELPILVANEDGTGGALYSVNHDNMDTVAEAFGLTPSEIYVFIGRFLMLAIVNEVPIGLALSNVFVTKAMMNTEPIDKDFKFDDPATYRSFEAMRVWDFDRTYRDEFTFQADDGTELIENGASIIVNNTNRDAFIDAWMRHKFYSRDIEVDLTVIGSGIKTKLIKDFFDVDEIRKLLYGVPEIDVDDWIAFTTVNGRTRQDGMRTRWFWDTVRGFSNQQRSQLLEFWTGLSRLPMGGFSGIGRWLQLQHSHNTTDYSSFPTASTCGLALSLPSYPSQQFLQARLTAAIEHIGYFGLK